MVTYLTAAAIPSCAMGVVLLLTSTGLALAGGPDTSPPNRFFCPPISALTKDPNTNLWSAGPGWQSYDLSFVDKITQFSGAQWKGTNVGQIFCLYRGELATDFPVLLAYKVLAYAPQGGKWSPNLGGYENCETPLQEECPFSIRLKPLQSDVYEQAQQLKRSLPASTRPGF